MERNNDRHKITKHRNDKRQKRRASRDRSPMVSRSPRPSLAKKSKKSKVQVNAVKPLFSKGQVLKTCIIGIPYGTSPIVGKYYGP